MALPRTVMAPEEMHRSKASDRLKHNPLGSFYGKSKPQTWRTETWRTHRVISKPCQTHDTNQGDPSWRG